MKPHIWYCRGNKEWYCASEDSVELGWGSTPEEAYKAWKLGYRVGFTRKPK